MHWICDFEQSENPYTGRMFRIPTRTLFTNSLTADPTIQPTTPSFRECDFLRERNPNSAAQSMVTGAAATN